MKHSIKTLLLAIFVVPALSIGFTSCADDDDDDKAGTGGGGTTNSYQATINMKQWANGMEVSLRTDGVKPFTNQKGQSFNVSRLRYLISDLTFHKSDGGTVTIDGYHFVDLADNSTLTYTPDTKIPQGNYSSISFKFGFDADDNTPGAYADLNSNGWEWPGMLGSGYHNMQLEGQYDSLGNDRFFATHMGTARDNSDPNNVVFENNHFVAEPANSAINVTADFSFDIIMNVEQWYEDTYEWDFTVWNAPIMPIYDAQKRLNENGATVFTVDVN